MKVYVVLKHYIHEISDVDNISEVETTVDMVTLDQNKAVDRLKELNKEHAVYGSITEKSVK